MKIKTQIMPSKQTFAKLPVAHEINYKALCVFVAIGFFLDDDTFFKDEVCLRPGSNYTLDESSIIKNSKPYFNWHYSPSFDSFKDTLEEYTHLLERIIKRQVNGKKVILPLSGGLDSRSIAMVLNELGNDVDSYSYRFKGGYPEHEIGQKIARVCGFNHNNYEIKESYLWDCINEIASLNNCFSEFTHPRQMSIFKELNGMNGIVSLGHWGDVLFNRGCPPELKECKALDYIKNKILKKGGLELAESLWGFWNLEGNFSDYFHSRIEDLFDSIEIENLSAKIRAFKTKFWAHRWTTTNLSIFQATNPVSLPYYDEEMCRFICTVPEKYLADRQLQIAHIKQNSKLAKITWQAHRPYNLFNYEFNKHPYNLIPRIFSKSLREINRLMGHSYIQRNWELQFLGDYNDLQLKTNIFESSFKNFIDKSIIEKFYRNFEKKNMVEYSHPISMLLTLSLWYRNSISNTKKSQLF